MAKTAAAKPVERGIAYWMERVVAEREKARESFDADAVHDLRVALRRCRSMAEGFQSVDGDPTWKKMRKAGKVIFSALGDLRDTQVLLEWIERLRSDCPPVAERLKSHCLQREAELKTSAAEVVDEFDTHRWLQWAQKLGERVQAWAIPPKSFRCSHWNATKQRASFTPGPCATAVRRLCTNCASASRNSVTSWKTSCRSKNSPGEKISKTFRICWGKCMIWMFCGTPLARSTPSLRSRKDNSGTPPFRASAPNACRPTAKRWSGGPLYGRSGEADCLRESNCTAPC